MSPVPAYPAGGVVVSPPPASTSYPASTTYPGPGTFPGSAGGIAPPPPPAPYNVPEIFTIDGVVMNTWAKSPTNMLALLHTPSKRNNNVLIAGRHGTLRTRSKYYNENLLTIPFVMQGAIDDGTVPIGSTHRIEFQKRWDELVTLLSRSGKMDMRLLRADSTIRQGFGEMLDVLDLTGVNTIDPYATFVANITMSNPFWQDVTPTTQVFISPTMGTTLALTSFAGTSAPIDDAQIIFTGPWTNPRLEAYVNGAPMEAPIYLQYGGTIPDGLTLTLDCSNWSVSGSTHPVYASLVHGGSSPYLSIQPSSALGTPQIFVSGSGTGANTRLSIQARRKFLVA